MSSTLLGHVPLTIIFESLEVTDASEIWLEQAGGLTRWARYFAARSRSRLAYVDRSLATRLRADGAAWRGDIEDDPCAVA